MFIKKNLSPYKSKYRNYVRNLFHTKLDANNQKVIPDVNAIAMQLNRDNFLDRIQDIMLYSPKRICYELKIIDAFLEGFPDIAIKTDADKFYFEKFLSISSLGNFNLIKTDFYNVLKKCILCNINYYPPIIEMAASDPDRYAEVMDWIENKTIYQYQAQAHTGPRLFSKQAKHNNELINTNFKPPKALSPEDVKFIF